MTVTEPTSAGPEARAAAARGVVDLGSVDEIVTADNLVIARRGGAPVPVVGEGEEPLAGGPLRVLVRNLRDYAELRHSPYGLTPAVMIGLITFFQILDSAAWSVAGPDVALALEINLRQIIAIQATIGTVAIFAAIAAGWLGDRTRRVPFVTVGTFFSGIFSMLSSRADAFGTMAGSRIADDVADEASGVTRFSLLADYYPPEQRGRLFAALGTVRRVGQLVAILLAGWMVVRFGFRHTFVVLGAPLVVLAVVAQLVLREPVRGYFERRALGATEDEARRENEPMSFGESWRATFGVRTIRRLMLASTVSSVADRAVGLFFPFFLADVYGLNAFERSLITIPAVVMALFGGVIGGGLIDRFVGRNPSRVLYVLGLFSLVSVGGVVLYALRPPLWVLVAASAVFAFGAALIGPARTVVFANVIPPNIRTAGLQITGLVELPALILVGSVMGFVQAEYGYSGLFWTSVPILVVGALIALSAAPFYDLDMRSAMAAALAEQEWQRARAAGSTKLLVCRDVEVEYDGTKVLFGVDFDVAEGEIVALLGTNGAGKSTLLRAITGLTQASGGAIVFDGRDITAMPPHEIAARGVVFMPGGRGVFPDLTVRENLLLGDWLNADPAGVDARLAEVFTIFGRLAERLDTRAGDLSGGEQQQLSLAQAFLCRPRLLLIDELSLGLAPQVVAELLEIVRRIRDTGVTVVVVEQSVNVALTLADRAVFMEKGEVRFTGPTSELLSRPDILRAVYVKGTGALSAGPATSAAERQRRQRLLELGQARPILEVDGLVKRYGGVTAVDGATFALPEGGVLGLIGPNGAGKTTIFDLISGFQLPDAGTVRYDGVDITRLAPEERARRGLIRRFQDARLFGNLTVTEALLVALDNHLRIRSTVLFALGAPGARRAERRLRARADALMELLELGPYRDTFVKELSTGVRRLVDLAAVLAAEPRVLLLDEPSSGIAQAEAENLAPLLRRVRHETGCSILIIEHDMPLISAVSDELVALVQGRVIARGTPAEVLEHPDVVESYLGTDEATIRRTGRAPRQAGTPLGGGETPSVNPSPDPRPPEV